MRQFLPKISLIAALLLLVCPQPVYAYVDPGAGSLILQLLLGGVAGALFAAKLYWRRLRSFFRSKETPSSAPPEEMER